MTEAMTTLETAISRSKKLRPRTKELYLQHVRAFLEFVRERHPRKAAKEDWTAGMVVKWRTSMRARKISPQSVNVALNALRFAAQNADRNFFGDAITRLDVPRDAAASASADQERALTWEEGRKLVAACEGTKGRDLRDTAIITLGLRTGMLRFSMCQLQVADITAKGSLTFTKKGGERHTITLDAVTHMALRAWTDWLVAHDQESGYVFRSLGRQRVSPKEEVAIGDQLTPDGLYRALHERAKEAELDGLKPHVFRKTFLAWVKRAGAKPGQIEAVTGHKSDGVGGDSSDTATPQANMLLPTWNKSLK